MRDVRTVAARVACVALAAAATAWAVSALTATYVGGDSMSPGLIRGDFVVLRRDAGGVRVGDIIWMSKAGWPNGVLHRVVALTLDGRMVTRGDANPVADRDPATRAGTRGVAVLVLPTGRLLALAEALARVVQSRVT